MASNGKCNGGPEEVWRYSVLVIRDRVKSGVQLNVYRESKEKEREGGIER